LPKGTDTEDLATYVLAVMEGGVMLSRSYGRVEPFDRTVRQLRQHFRLLLGAGAGRTGTGGARGKKSKKRAR
jgi:TetR/AcrR family transcriptional regulator, transcriptional repressor for nem operon